MRFEKKTLAAAVFAAALVTAGAATVLDSYGVISGTADVTAAVSMTVDGGNSEVTLTKNTAREITAEDNMEVYNATSGSSEETITTSGYIEMTGADGQTKTLSIDLSGVDKVGLQIDGTVLEEVDLSAN